MDTTLDPRRPLGLVGSPNFRDAGGYQTQCGGELHWGRLFRSGHLAGLTATDQERLAGLELDLVCDLRRPDEQALEPSTLPDEVRVHAAPITPGSQASVIYSDSTQLGGADAMHEFMCDINREFVKSQSETFREVFTAVLESGAERVLFHCSAGKDRTGFAVAMLQLALGVAQADLEADYLLSRHYYIPEEQLDRVRDKYPVAHLSDADLLPMMRADIAYLRAALATVDQCYSSRDEFLARALGLDAPAREELRRRFVRRDRP